MSEIKIDTDIPMPPAWKKREQYPLREMEVGQSFAVEVGKQQSVREAISQFKRRNPGYVFSVRKFNDAYRCWRIA